ncbi:hypothetical protein FSS13T_13700 [Flavobacterium saliperosum S13]|uniref:Histidyl-tRNA synthetase n=2 Tax=Flavobacterium saliperosum TaxID=329186 RepID=A0A1G4VE46_9FLAO|nr:DUF6495 family protein [Flavobacterium saliperosum]ESU25905.1 hypothetical protein FSS13T_13700 [Flavobacterium saliperosum S13]SCX05352.1 hypothetical protein SAMN02927925_00803 [Flavobacterium saliperosum]
MKYTRLTKEQLEELHPEFINFLASQSIDKNEWDTIKAQNPEAAEQEIDIFSDLIWEGVLGNAKYLEHYSKNFIFLFHCTEVHMMTIIIRALVTEVDLLHKEGLQWLSDNLFTDNVEVQRGQKVFADDRNMEIFKLIQQGAIFTDGDLFQQMSGILEQ